MTTTQEKNYKANTMEASTKYKNKYKSKYTKISSILNI